MLARIVTLGVITISLSGCVAPDNALDRDLDALLAALPGTYAGKAPVALAEDGALQDVFHKIVPIDAPQFGDEVLYYQLSAAGPHGPPLQMKIFVFDTSADREANRMSAFIFTGDTWQGNLEQAPEEWPELEPASLMSFPESCAFEWKPIDHGFEGHVSASRCVYPSRAFKQDIRPEMTYRISGDRFEWDEALHADDMEVIVSTGGVLEAHRR